MQRQKKIKFLLRLISINLEIIHYTIDSSSQTGFVEFKGSAFVSDTEKDYHQKYAIKLEIKDEKIILYREHRDSLAILEAFVRK